MTLEIGMLSGQRLEQVVDGGPLELQRLVAAGERAERGRDQYADRHEISSGTKAAPSSRSRQQVTAAGCAATTDRMM